MNKNFGIFVALVCSLLALVISINALMITGGFNKIKSSLLTLEFKMETKRYLLEAKAHLLEAKALYNFKRQPDKALGEIQKAEQFLGMAKLTASEGEIKKIEQINQELITLDQQIASGRSLGSNFVDKTIGVLDRFLNLVRK